MQDLWYVQVMGPHEPLQEANPLRDLGVGGSILRRCREGAVEELGHDVLLEALARKIEAEAINAVLAAKVIEGIRQEFFGTSSAWSISWWVALAQSGCSLKAASIAA